MNVYMETNVENCLDRKVCLIDDFEPSRNPDRPGTYIYVRSQGETCKTFAQVRYEDFRSEFTRAAREDGLINWQRMAKLPENSVYRGIAEYGM